MKDNEKKQDFKGGETESKKGKEDTEKYEETRQRSNEIFLNSLAPMGGLDCIVIATSSSPAETLAPHRYRISLRGGPSHSKGG